MWPSSRGKNVNATVRRGGDVQTQPASHANQGATTAVDTQQWLVDGANPLDEAAAAEQEEERGWERTSTVCGQLPNPDIVFKCVDAETAVVVGSAVDEREAEVPGGACPEKRSVSSAGNADEASMGPNPGMSGSVGAMRGRDLGITPSLHDEGTTRQDHLKSKSMSGKGDSVGAEPGGPASTSVEHAAFTATDNTQAGGVDVNIDEHPSVIATDSPQDMQWQPQGPRQPKEGSDPETVRPQVCVPLAGAGDSGCIGMVGVQGFSTGRLIGDDDWRDWFMHRMEPLNRGENRNVKRLKLVRPRGLPDKGRLEHVPTGVAAKVVYGSVEKISRKRGLPVYAVR